MALVPAGEFEMGSDANDALAECQKYRSDCNRSWFENEEPPHTVNLDAFYIDLYEVSNALFAEFLNAQGNQSEGGATWLDADSDYARIHQSGGVWRPDSGYGDHPVVEVTWYGAAAYCGWRGARLPTEAEWEKAARGTDGRTYPWGDAFNGRLVNFCDKNCDYDWADKDYDDGYKETAPVGSYQVGVSPYGLFDMAGNVWEWVQDWYSATYYASSPSRDPGGPSSGDYRVLRGGSWVNVQDYLRAAYRNYLDPDGSGIYFGFRCAVSPGR